MIDDVNEILAGATWPVSGIPNNEQLPELNIKPGPNQTVRIRISKQTHGYPRYENESEHETTLVINPK